jgi:hypothetical protein
MGTLFPLAKEEEEAEEEEQNRLDRIGLEWKGMHRSINRSIGYSDARKREAESPIRNRLFVVLSPITVYSESIHQLPPMAYNAQ